MVTVQDYQKDELVGRKFMRCWGNERVYEITKVYRTAGQDVAMCSFKDGNRGLSLALIADNVEVEEEETGEKKQEKGGR